MKTSQIGIDLIKSFEGLELKAYLCPAKVWTIGYGHTKGVKQGQVITETEAEQLLKQDLKQFEDVINAQQLHFNQNQFDALVSFCYNVGSGNFNSSTLLKRAKENPNDPTIATQFLRWNKAKGVVLAGLTRRRKAESILYFTQ